MTRYRQSAKNPKQTQIFCDSCGWNLVTVPKGSNLGFGKATKDGEYYYNHKGCITGEVLE